MAEETRAWREGLGGMVGARQTDQTVTCIATWWSMCFRTGVRGRGGGKREVVQKGAGMADGWMEWLAGPLVYNPSSPGWSGRG